MLTPIVLALALGAQCQEPTSANDLPPCSAVPVPGCLEGYRPLWDEQERLVYVCASSRGAPPGPAAAAPGAPRAQATPAPPAPSAAFQAAPAPRRERRGHVALVLLPGGTSGLERSERRHVEALGALALELRGGEGGGRVRLGIQYASFGRVAELAVKYDFFDHQALRPFLGLGAGAASVDPDPGWRPSGSALAGFDLYLSPRFFATIEAQGRVFTARAAGPGHGLTVSGLRQAAVLAGFGLYL